MKIEIYYICSLKFLNFKNAAGAKNLTEWKTTFRTEYSARKNIINFRFPRSQKKKKDIKTALYQQYWKYNSVN